MPRDADQTPALSRRRERDRVDAVLNELRDEHKFIGSWERVGSRYLINRGPGHPGWGPYDLRQIHAFLDGCRAMGAGI